MNSLHVGYDNDAERGMKLYIDALNVAKSEDRLENHLKTKWLKMQEVEL